MTKFRPFLALMLSQVVMDNLFKNPLKKDLDPDPILCPIQDLDPDPILAVQKGSRSRSDPLFRSFCLKRGGGCLQFFFYKVKYPLQKVSPYSQYTLLYVGFYHFHFHYMANCVWRYPHLSQYWGVFYFMLKLMGSDLNSIQHERSQILSPDPQDSPDPNQDP